MTLRDILKETFKQSNIPENISGLKMGDIEEWDSLGHFNLILAIENYYKIQFDMNEIETIVSVADIEKKVNNALSQK